MKAKEEATAVLPGDGPGSSLGLHIEILLANRQIFADYPPNLTCPCICRASPTPNDRWALDVLYKDNDWLLISIEDEAAEQANFELLRMPKRRPFNV